MRRKVGDVVKIKSTDELRREFGDLPIFGRGNIFVYPNAHCLGTTGVITGIVKCKTPNGDVEYYQIDNYIRHFDDWMLCDY